MDTRQCSLIRSNLASLTGSPERTHALSNSFYSILFARHPETREFFPATMGGQRDRILRGLAHIVDGLDRPESVLPLVRQLGREHRKHGLDPARFACLTEAMALAVEQANGDDWTRDLAESWCTALDLITTTMADAAEADEGPAAWAGTVVEHRLVTDDIAVIRLQLDRPMDYTPGQYVSVQVPGRLRMWRYLSPATPANSAGIVEFHVRRVSGGWVSPSIVRHTQVGETWVLGSPLGSLGARDDGDRAGRARLMIASGTGIAPIRAQLMSMAQRTDNTPVHVFYSGHFSYDLYDLTTLDALSRTAPWLTVIPVVENAETPRWHTGPSGPQTALREGVIGQVVADHGTWTEHDVQICGSPSMVRATTFRLRAAGVPVERIHNDPQP
ncbi:FAD-binding oxidoreductase [Rhodococcus zopfii]|uniref:FAD-binding oxidoreductase n=1 Tax=Rhodococcus zopfii TaxID=43772 RepID=UPI003528CC21